MANTRQKASAARRSRASVRKDYTAGRRQQAYEDRLDKAGKSASVNLWAGVAQGAAAGFEKVTDVVGENISSHEKVEKGIERVAAEQGIDVKDIGYEPKSMWEKITTRADSSDAIQIKDLTFNFESLSKIGTPKTEKGAQAMRLFDERKGSPTEGKFKSLYESYGMSLDQASTPKPLDISNMELKPLQDAIKTDMPVDNSSIIKNAVNEIQKENVVPNLNNNNTNMSGTSEPWKNELDAFYQSYQEYGGENVNQFIQENPQFKDYKMWQGDYDRWFVDEH